MPKDQAALERFRSWSRSIRRKVVTQRSASSRRAGANTLPEMIFPVVTPGALEVVCVKSSKFDHGKW